MYKHILTILIIFSLLFVLGCSAESSDEDFNNPYSGTCSQGKESADCNGECGQFVDSNEDGICDRSQ